MTTRVYKAFSMWQPWASLLVGEYKRVETRSWPLRGLYTGEPILIHAAKRWTGAEQETCEEFPFRQNLTLAARRGLWDFQHPPRGAIIGVATWSRAWPVETLLPGLGPMERAFGDFSAGRFGWLFATMKPIKPIPYRGAQGLFRVELDETQIEYVERSRP